MSKIICWVGIVGMVAACSGAEGPEGPPGPAGASGASGTNGENGSNGEGGTSGSSVTSSPDTFTSGTRIHARTTTTTTTSPDGAKLTQTGFGGWYDSTLSIDCSASLASDGTLRCLPSSTTPYVFYVDAACATPVILVAGGAAATCGGASSTPSMVKYFARADATTGCNDLYPVGGQVTPTATYYEKSGTNCLNTTVSITAGYEFYDASSTTMVDPTTFAAMTVTSTTTN